MYPAIAQNVIINEPLLLILPNNNIHTGKATATIRLIIRNTAVKSILDAWAAAADAASEDTADEVADAAAVKHNSLLIILPFLKSRTTGQLLFRLLHI